MSITPYVHISSMPEKDAPPEVWAKWYVEAAIPDLFVGGFGLLMGSILAIAIAIATLFNPNFLIGDSIMVLFIFSLYAAPWLLGGIVNLRRYCRITETTSRSFFKKMIDWFRHKPLVIPEKH